MTGSLMDQSDGTSLLDVGPAKKAEATVYLMRHGRTALDVAQNRSDGWLDFPLTDEGREGIIPAQQLLKNVPLTAIYTPDLKRTKETAEIVASGTLSHPKVVVDDDLRTWNLGALSGMKKKYGRPEVTRLKSNPDERAPGGESFNAFRGRFLPTFQDDVQKLKGKPALMVLSGSNLRLLGNILCGDDSTLDLDESGLACLYRIGGVWTYDVYIGHEDAEPYES